MNEWTKAKARGMRPLQDIMMALGLMNVLYWWFGK